jgi:hypothetical protein
VLLFGGVVAAVLATASFSQGFADHATATWSTSVQARQVQQRSGLIPKHVSSCSSR